MDCLREDEREELKIWKIFVEALKEQLDRGCFPLIMWDLPKSLYEEFKRKVIDPYYAASPSEAVRDLMRKAIIGAELSG